MASLHGAGKYIVWSEYIKDLPEDYWSELFGNQSEQNIWLSYGSVQNIWIYNLETRVQTRAIENVMQLGSSDNFLSFDVSSNNIVYIHNLSIYIYDILTRNISKVGDHSRNTTIVENQRYGGFGTVGFLTSVRMKDNLIIYTEYTHIYMQYDGAEPRCLNINNHKNTIVEMSPDSGNQRTYDIYRNSIIGWNTVYKFSGGHIQQLKLFIFN